MTPDEYCRDRAAKSGSSFYYSFLYLARHQKQAIIALYAFCREVDDVVDETSNMDTARTQLSWWRQEIGRTFQGNPTHPVGKSLATALQYFDLREKHFSEIIDGMEMDLEQHHYADFEKLSLYCHRVASVVGLLSVEIFGYNNSGTLEYAKNLGLALQITNIIRDVREDAERGRIYLPQNDLQRFNVDVHDIMDLRTSPELVECLRFQADRAQSYYDLALQALPEEDRYMQRTALIMGAIYRTTLNEIENDDFNVMVNRVSLTPLRKFWIAWRTAAKEKHLYKNPV